MNDSTTPAAASNHPGNGQGFHLNEDLCLDLIHELLSTDECERALSHAAECPRCERLLQEMVGEHERLRALGTVRILSAAEADRPIDTPKAEDLRRWSALSDLWKTLWAPLRGGRLWQPRSGLLVGVVAAAVVVLLLARSQVGESPDTELLHMLPTRASDIQFRAATRDAAGGALAVALEAYGAQDHERAAQLLQEIEVLGQLDTIRKIYLGNVLAWQGEYQRAVSVLRTVSVRLLPDPWNAETRWTLHVALRKSGHKASADSLLRVLADEPGEIGQRARDLLGSGGSR
ncbi:MAG: hypothetical protein KAY24_17380 [Candidatus Eisenbacteria sp.]|nr:hypothetical protein [Candidatus Eisenbacteria bacterium]